MSVAVVLMTHNRGGQCLVNLLASLWDYQSVLPSQVIVIDTGSQAVGSELSKFPLTMHLRYPMQIFNMPLALNIGIRACRSRFVLCTGADFIFGRNVIETVANRLRKGNRFVLAECGTLPKDADLSDPFRDWNSLCEMAERCGRKSVGAIQAASRVWLCKVRGYDERFAGGLGGVDDNMKLRASRVGLELDWIPFEEAQILHQWHPRSPLKEKTTWLFKLNPEIIWNSRDWGKL